MFAASVMAVASVRVAFTRELIMRFLWRFVQGIFPIEAPERLMTTSMWSMIPESMVPASGFHWCSLGPSGARLTRVWTTCPASTSERLSGIPIIPLAPASRIRRSRASLGRSATITREMPQV